MEPPFRQAVDIGCDHVRPRIMAFPKKMGLYAVCTEATEQIVAWEAAAKETDVKVAFCEHGGPMDKQNYKVWTPFTSSV